MRRFRRLHFHLLMLLQCGATIAFANVLTPDTGKAGLHQRLLDLGGRFKVLNISVRPGCEDAGLLAYLRFGRGAKVISAYVTNGEAGENDLEFEYPAALAATRRREAGEFMSKLDGEVHFLNLPDIGAASSKERVFETWDQDSLRTRLLRLIAGARPDLIVLGQDRLSSGDDSLTEILREEIAGCVKDLSQGSQAQVNAGIFERWQVKRFVVASSAPSGITFPTQLVHPHLKRMFKDIGEELLLSYRSLSVQRRLWSDAAPKYTLERIRTTEKLKWGDDGLPGPPSRKIAFLAGKIDRLIAQQNKIWRSPRTYLRNVALLLDSIDSALLRRRDLSNMERRDLVNWRGGLESLRVLLLGVQVRYSISENILTDRQLVFFSIDSLSGQSGGGSTEIYFPAVERGWILNEASTSKLPLRVHEPYRLVSPSKVEYDLPFSDYGMNRSTAGTTLHVFVIHLAEKREESFVYRIAHRIRFAPRLVAEVVTPIVRVVPGERVVVRITNNSRDGVADSVGVHDSLARSEPVLFRLNSKGSAITDTLRLAWRESIPEGTFVVPIQFGRMPVAAFAARQFEVKVDTGLQVGVLSQYQSGPVDEALRRLEMRHVRRVSVTGFEEHQLEGLHVVVVDHRALTFAPNVANLCASLTQYVRNGGRLVVLSQDALVWNRSAFAGILKLQSDNSLDPGIPVVLDTMDSFVSTPNNLLPHDFAGWIVRRASNRVLLDTQDHSRVVVRTEGGNLPLVVSLAEGAGRFTYVDLSLDRQLVNINPGAFRILANLLRG